MPSLSRSLILAIALMLLVGFLLLWGPAQCQKVKTAEKQAELARGQADAAIDAGAEAGNTVANVTTNNIETDRAVSSAKDDIRRAPEGQKGTAAVSAACRFKANRNKPECQKGTGQ